MAENEKDALIREAHRLAQAAGYAGFRREYFSDPDVIREWPDPAERERALRAQWQELGEVNYSAFARVYADASTQLLTRHITALRAELRLGEASDLYERARATEEREQHGRDGVPQASECLAPGAGKGRRR